MIFFNLLPIKNRWIYIKTCYWRLNLNFEALFALPTCSVVTFSCS